MSLLHWPSLKRIVKPGSGSIPTDEDLLARFLDRREERAFEELVHRHAGLVYGTAIRMVRDRHTAEDIFQATFLVLARDGQRIRRRGRLPAWLHRVALQLSRKSLRRSRKLLALEIDPETLTRDPLHGVDAAVLAFNQQVLDEELQNLPARYRDPLVLHFLEGLTFQDTARALGVSAAAVDGRLRRAKKLLQSRLARRGVTVGVALTAVSWSQSAAQAALGGSFVQSAVVGGMAAAQGVPFLHTVSPEAVHLAIQETAMLTAGKAAVVAAGVALTAGAGWLGAGGMGSGEQGAGPGAARSQSLDTMLADGQQGDRGTLMRLAQAERPTSEQQPVELRIVTGTADIYARVKAEYPDLKVAWDERTGQIVLQGTPDRVQAALADPQLASRPTAEEIGVMKKEIRERLAEQNRPLSRELEARNLVFVPTKPGSLTGEWVRPDLIQKLEGLVDGPAETLPLNQALDTVARRYGLNITLNANRSDADREALVNLPEGQRPLKELLDLVLAPLNLTHKLNGEVVEVRLREIRPQQTELQERLSSARPLPDSALATPQTYFFANDTNSTSGNWVNSILASKLNSQATFLAETWPLADALDALAKQYSLNIAIASDVNPLRGHSVTLPNGSRPVKEMLQEILDQYQLTYTIFGDLIEVNLKKGAAEREERRSLKDEVGRDHVRMIRSHHLTPKGSTNERLNFMPRRPTGARPSVDVHQKLQQVIVSEAETLPLSNALEALARRHDLDIGLSISALEELNISEDAPVLVPEGSRPLKTLLDQILPPLGLTYTVQNGVLVVGSKPAGQESVADANVRIPPQRSRTELAIEDVLGEEAALVFKDYPLKDLERELSRKYQIPMMIDVASLKQAGLNADEALVSGAYTNMPLGTALNLLLGNVQGTQLTTVVEDDALKITTPARLQANRARAEMADRLRTDSKVAQGPPAAGVKKMVILPMTREHFDIAKAAHPEVEMEWDESTQQVVIHGATDLVNALTAEVLRSIPEPGVVGTLRLGVDGAQLIQPGKADAEVVSPSRTFQPNAETGKFLNFSSQWPEAMQGQWANSLLLKKLDQEIVSKDETRQLSLVLEDLSKQYNIDIALNLGSLADLGHSRDTLIRTNAGKKPLKAVLDEMLSPLGLAYTVQGDLLEVGRKPAESAVAATQPESSDVRISKGLSQVVPVDVQDMPLQKFTDWLSSTVKIPVVIDKPALATEGIEEGVLISGKYEGVPLRSSLKLMLGNVKGGPLVAIVEDDVLKITTSDRVELTKVTRVYNVKQFGTAAASLPNMLQPLLVSWRAGVNPGSAELYGNILIVRANPAAIEDVEKFLEELLKKLEAP